MEVYKLGKTIENQVIDIHLALQQLNEARDALKGSLKRRKEIPIVENDTTTRKLTPQSYLQMEMKVSLMQKLQT